MSANPTCLIRFVLLTLLTVPVVAQENRDRDRDRGRDGGRQQESAEEEMREGGILREELLSEEAEGMEEGMPSLRGDAGGERASALRLPPGRTQWKLGVYAQNTETGVEITRVIRRSAAWRAGLEPGDRIVTVNGYQVGWVDDRLYPLGTELQRRGGRRGHVTLLLQNVRNDRLLPRAVQLDDAARGP